MTSSMRPLTITLCALLIWGGAAAPVRAEDPVPQYSVQRFQELKERWEIFASSGVELRVEGRTAAVSESLLRFRGCSVPFRPAEGVRLPTDSGNVMEVRGRLRRPNGEWAFLVEEYKRLPGDMERFRFERNRLPEDDPQPWYRLAEWAAGRSAFYDDPDLKRKAREAYEKGLRIERRQLAEGDVDGLLALADKAARLEVSPSVRLEFLHEAYHLQWRKMKHREQPKVSQLADQVARTLPGCRVVPEAPDTELQQRYWDAPLIVYRSADRAQRRKLHRIFYSELGIAAIEQKADPEGRNGLAIAREIDERFPERHALAEMYRDRALDFRLRGVESLTRSEVTALIEQLRDRNRSDDAADALSRWVEAKIERARSAEAGELVEAAQACLDFLNDRQRAVRLLKQAWEKAPEVERAAELLTRLGYRLHDGQWMTEQAVAALPSDPVEQAMREGRVVAGMTPPQVRNALGAPTSVMRVATAGQINLVWQYRDRGSSPLVVHFLRRSSRNAQPAEVVRFFQMDAPR